MNWDTVFVALITLIGSIFSTWAANSKTRALLEYRLDLIEKKQDKHNSVVERTYALETRMDVQDEKIKVANHRLDDLERSAGHSA